MTVDGTAGNEAIQVVASGSSATVLGLAAQTIVSGAESGAVTDVLTVSGGAGHETIRQCGRPPTMGRLDGGDGNDTITRRTGAIICRAVPATTSSSAGG